MVKVRVDADKFKCIFVCMCLTSLMFEELQHEGILSGV